MTTTTTRPTEGMTELEETMFFRARRAERLSIGFRGVFWDGDSWSISDEEWFDLSERLGVLMPSPETRAATLALLDFNTRDLNLPAPEGGPDVARTYFTVRKAARLAKQFENAGVTDVREVTPIMWREARIAAGLSSNDAPSDITRAAVAGIIDQRMGWRA